jgi:hypothetical protein
LSFALVAAGCCEDAASAGAANHRARRAAAAPMNGAPRLFKDDDDAAMAMDGIAALGRRSEEGDARETTRAADAAARPARRTVCIDPTSALIVAVPLI